MSTSFFVSFFFPSFFVPFFLPFFSLFSPLCFLLSPFACCLFSLKVLSFLLAILGWCASKLAFYILAEEGEVGEIENLANLLYRLCRVAKVEPDVFVEIFLNPA